MNGRFDTLPYWAKAWVILSSLLGLGLIFLYFFGLNILGKSLLDITYYWFLLGFFFPLIFLLFPARSKDRQPLWYDYVLAAGSQGSGFLLAWYGPSMALKPWTNPEFFWQIVVALFLVLAILEGARRAAGVGFAVVALLLGAYPLLAPYMPGLLWGPPFTWKEVLGYSVYSTQGLLGLPMRSVGELLVGFLILAAFFVATGAGKVFLDLASALFGWTRGGAAKVSVVASGFFGSLSGSILSNVVSTGSITIPSMIRSGFPKTYAAAVEACASTGGVLMPPVMGAVAFVMATLLGVPYGQVVMAALVPSFLYYLSLFIHVDFYAAKHRLKATSLPSFVTIVENIRKGIPFILVLAFLVLALVYLRLERLAPFYALAILLLLLALQRQLPFAAFKEAILSSASLISQTLALILPIGLILAGLLGTGVAPALTGALIQIGKNNLFLVLAIGILVAFLLGMAGIMVAAYILLAVTLAPAFTRLGDFYPLAVHLFIAYWSVLSAITPPVAVAAFLAARLAGANPLATSWEAMKLGLAIYFIPFFFLFEPALLLKGEPLSIAYHILLSTVGIFLLVGGLEGYLWGLGELPLWVRPAFTLGGLLMAILEGTSSLLAALVVLALIGWLGRKERKP